MGHTLVMLWNYTLHLQWDPCVCSSTIRLKSKWNKKQVSTLVNILPIVAGVPQIPLEASKEMLQRALDLLQQMSTHSVCCYIHLAEMWLNQ